MKPEKYNSIKTEVKLQIQSLFSMAKSFSFKSSEIDERFLRIIRDYIHSAKGSAKARASLVEYAQGFRDASNDYIYRNHLVHGFYYNGEFYSTHSSRDDYYIKKNLSVEETTNILRDKSVPSGHYYKDTLKPYFTMLGN